MSTTPGVREVPGGTGDTFPYWGMRLLGAVQINIGILVFVIGIADLTLTMISHDKDVETFGSQYQRVVTMTVVSSPLWSGLWFSICGALGACLPLDQESSLAYCRIAFLVLNVLCCSLFAPACAIINGFISYTRHNLARGEYQWLISLIICFLAVSEVVVAAVSACVTCCRSTLRSTQVHVVVKPCSVRKTQNDLLNSESTKSCPSLVGSINHRQNNHSQNDAENNDNRSPISTSRTVQDILVQAKDVNQLQSNRKDANDYRLPQDTRSQEQDLAIISGYSALKKWALPRL